MPVGIPVLLEIAFIPARRDHRLILNRENDHRCAASRGFDRDLPGIAVRPAANCLNIAAQVQQSGIHAVFPQVLSSPATNKSLGNAAQVNFHTVRHRHGAGFGVISDLCVIHMGQQPLQGFRLWHLIALRGEPPGPHDRIN